jgi:hypothetical protein
MPESYDDPIICEHCSDTLHEGDDYYGTPLGDYCPDCWYALTRSWRCRVGDTIERC